MDNNLINIDDLFKQRLGGGEEQERDGAWMRMKELLEDDERRRPAGFWWRRAVGFGGALALLATATWGSYEAVTAFRHPGQGEGTVGIASHNNGGEAIASAATGDNGHSEVSQVSEHSVLSKSTNNDNSKITPHSAGQATKHSIAAKAALVSKKANKAALNSGTGATASNTLVETPANGDAVVTTSTSQIDHPNNSGSNSMAGNSPAIIHIDQADAAVRSKRQSQHKRNSNTRVTRTADKTVATGNMLPADLEREMAAAAVDNSTEHAHVAVSTAQKPGSRRQTVTKVPGTSLHQKTDHVVSVRKSEQEKGNTQHNVVSRMKERSGKIVSTGNIGGTASATTNNEKLVPAVTTENPLQHLSASAKSNNQRASKDLENTVATALKGTEETTIVKKNVRQITLKQTTKGAFTGNTVTSLDTINDKNVILEQKTVTHRSGTQSDNEHDEAVSALTAGTAQPTVPTSGTGVAMSKTAKTSNASSGLEPAGKGNTAAQVTTSPLLASAPPKAANVPVAATPAEPVPAAAPEAAKPAETAKKKSGMHFLQKLSMAFNDLKMNVSNAQVGTGLTGGINTTFFGPNSFKGFQFGGVANFVFDDKWSASAELKYFHRMNNNYAMHVTYDKYEAVAGGYMMETKDKSYSFSTLHSFELPLALRYTYKNFTVLAGANFQYAMAINPGDNEVSKDPNMLPVFATTIGPNSTPSLNGSSDFGARVGIGYLFGFNMKVAPNVNLDLRNVQTFWDNASGSGSIKVSEQLYKSPSLQFSIIYRLGHGSED